LLYRITTRSPKRKLPNSTMSMLRPFFEDDSIVAENGNRG
jgi:hypothetical protein